MRNAHGGSAHGQSRSTLTANLALAQTAKAVERALDSEALTTVFRIYTEEQRGMASVVAEFFDGASLIFVTGLYKGQTEAGVIVEVIADYSERAKVVKLASTIVDKYKQDVALVTMQNAKTFASLSVYNHARQAARV